ncbi:MAG: hypothetical protein JNJ78_08670 [Anaerolineae bacterium]|nr:hypothetical protein [Anaerolineae bacterium]
MLKSRFRFTFSAVIILTLTLTFSIAQTRSESLPLSLNQTLTGQLSVAGESVSYTLDHPENQDVIVFFEADHVLLDSYCLGDSSASEDCYRFGGGGDGSVSITRLLPASGQSTITITLTRPYNGLTNYQLSAYALTPQPLEFSQPLALTEPSDQPFQLYALEADPAEPFTAYIADLDPDGSFLWAAHQPFLQPSVSAEQPSFMPTYVDGASSGLEAQGLNRLQLYHLADDQFRLLVGASSAYTLASESALLPALNASQARTVNLSYRSPLKVIPLQAAVGDTLNLNLDVTTGSGALARIHESGDPVGTYIALGDASTTGSVFPRSGLLQHTVVTAGQLVLVLQIPFQFTRESLALRVSWQLE